MSNPNIQNAELQTVKVDGTYGYQLTLKSQTFLHVLFETIFCSPLLVIKIGIICKTWMLQLLS
jgi:hypothetical protein